MSSDRRRRLPASALRVRPSSASTGSRQRRPAFGGEDAFGGVGVWGDAGAGGFAGVLRGLPTAAYAGAFSNNSSVNPTLQACERDNGRQLSRCFRRASMPGLQLGRMQPASDHWRRCDAGLALWPSSSVREGMSGCNNYTLMGDTSGNTYVNAATGGTIHLESITKTL